MSVNSAECLCSACISRKSLADRERRINQIGSFLKWQGAAHTRAKDRGRLFVRLYASAKQLVDNFPGRFPYLEYDVKEVERLALAPKVDTQGSK